MTLEELLGKSADDWEKLSDKELTEILSPFFAVARPKKETVLPTMKKVTKKRSSVSNSDVNQVLNMVKSLGIKF